jgi:hypothetical protein
MCIQQEYNNDWGTYGTGDEDGSVMEYDTMWMSYRISKYFSIVVN